jgi:hypothetical protein
MLRTSSIGNREFLQAEHCRYGTRDLRFGINPDLAALASVLLEQSAFQGTYAYP